MMVLRHWVFVSLLWTIFLTGLIDRAEAATEKADPSDQFFAAPEVRVFKIEVSDAAFVALQRQPRAYVSGAFSDGKQVLTNVGVHLKGMGSFRAVDGKPSFSLKFDEFTKGASYAGLTKLMLNNSVQDTSYMAELLGTQLFRDAGVPAARVTYARVLLNGRDLGLYVAIEGMNKQFLKRHFKKGGGNLYEGYLADLDGRLEQDGGAVKDRADVGALLTASKTNDPEKRFAQLGRLLDLERFASFGAMEVLLSHWDGYCIHTNNYRLYHDPKTDKMVFIAHGLDGVFRRPNISIQPPIKSIVSRALFTTSGGRKLYEQRLRELYTNVFRVEVITNRLNDALIRLRTAGLPSNELAELEHNASLMRQRVVERVQRVGEQMAGIEPTALAFDAAGLARLDGWREEPDIGAPHFDQVKLDGKTVLHIDGNGVECRASWRLGTYLKPGQYQFEGLVRTAKIQSGGAGLRISGATRNQRIGGDTTWRPLRHAFIVKEGEGDVEFVCELRTYQGGGEVWFDAGSLQLRRMP
jgi:hypothetical protein